MLTKQKRAAITERIKDIDVFNDSTFYTAITGKRRPEETSYMEDLGTMARVIIDLCDTSDMIELQRSIITREIRYTMTII